MAAAAFGVVAAISIPTARAGLLPTLPTITLPPIPSLPLITTTSTTTPTVPALPTGTGTGTGVSPTTTSSNSGGGGVTTTMSTATTDAPVEGASVSGAIRLPSGAYSIPISSVQAPARLGIDRITISPRTISARGQRVRLVVRVTDSRGYRVRGASVDVRSSPARMASPGATRMTSTDGTVTLQVSTTSRLPLRRFALKLVVRAYEARSGSPAKLVRRTASVPVRPR
jgi:hypothetical protein